MSKRINLQIRMPFKYAEELARFFCEPLPTFDAETVQHRILGMTHEFRCLEEGLKWKHGILTSKDTYAGANKRKTRAPDRHCLRIKASSKAECDQMFSLAHYFRPILIA